MKRKLLIMTGICMLTLAGCQEKQAEEVQEPSPVLAEEKEAAGADNETASKEESTVQQTEVTAEAKAIMPLPAQYAEEAGDEMPDGTYPVSFTAKDLIQTEDGYTLTMEFYDYDRYDKDDIRSMKVGDTIHTTVKEFADGVANTIHKDLVVESVNITSGEETEPIGVDINGGIEEGGVYLYYDSDFDVYVNMFWDSSATYYSIGTGTIPVSKEFEFVDCFDYETLPDGVVTGYEDLPDSLTTGDGADYFIANNMEAVIRNGEIVQLVRNWVP
ncbi:MAG: hypothetical protein II273_04710 [Lachnospiraceae bacterium]|nr:hypothetical protein [Lachnospiraceae bacterium]